MYTKQYICSASLAWTIEKFYYVNPLKPLLINMLRFNKSAPILARFMEGMHKKIIKKSSLPASVLPASPYLCPPVSDPALPVIKAV